MKRIILLPITVILLTATCLTAQKFSIPLEGFSKKKTAYFYMENNVEITGTLSGFKRTKGLIETVKMKDLKGKKVKMDPEKIDYMYLAPSNLGKFGAALEGMNNVNRWEKTTTIDTTLIKEGYVFFEKVSTKVKKKTDDLMLQLMNPSFSQKVKIYHDPFAKETASVGVGGITVAGGLDKSYYIKKDSDKSAYRLLKKNYKEQFVEIFGDSPEFMEKYGNDIKWNQFETHVHAYTELMVK
ncbi:MAG: hypothetical protein AB8G11_21705 [Saprospiraceae bacterium]